MKRNKLIIIYIIAIGCDFVSTYFTTPDLKYESNFIVKYLMKGWEILIIVNIIFALIVIGLYRFYQKHPFLPKTYVQIFKNIICFKWRTFSKEKIISIIGFLLIRGMILSTFIVSISNLLQGLQRNNTIASQKFHDFVKSYLYYRNIIGFDLLYAVFVSVFILLILGYYNYFNKQKLS